MKWWFNRWKQPHRWDSPYYRDYYGYADDDPYRWRRILLKQVVISMALFGIFITFHEGEHWTAKMLNNGVRYVLNKEIDLVYLKERTGLDKYYPGNIDLSVFKNLPVMNKQKAAAVLAVPLEGKVVGNYGWRTDTNTKEQKFVEGIDWQAPVGTPVKAAADGRVKAVADSTQYGKTIILQHGNELETVYGYCTDITVQNGDPVTQGQVIAKTGRSQGSDLGRLYLEVRFQGQAIDPKSKMEIVGP